jgi:hypothetical protein
MGWADVDDSLRYALDRFRGATHGLHRIDASWGAVPKYALEFSP